MALQFDTRNKAILRALDDDFAIDANGEVATVTGDMKLTVVRFAHDQFELKLKLPGGEPLDIKIRRIQLLPAARRATGQL